MPSTHASIFDPIEDAIRDIADGKMIIVTDDEHRENEGDLIMAAEKATPEAITMMIRYCSGIICVPAEESVLRRLGLGPMVQQNREAQRTDFTVTVDAAKGVSTGISASDRTKAIRIVADPTSKPEDLVQPGHIFPLRARRGGILERAGHTEAAVDLARLAGLKPVGVLCELVNDDGSVQRLPQLIEFKKKFELRMISTAQLIEYRLKREKLIEEIMCRPFESSYGKFDLHVFRSKLDGRQHLAFVYGKLGTDSTLVRMHSANALEDVFHEVGSGSKQILSESFKVIRDAGAGAVLYMESSSSDLNAASSDRGQIDLRDYGIGAQMLVTLGMKKIILISNSNNRKVVGLDGYGLEIVGYHAI